MMELTDYCVLCGDELAAEFERTTGVCDTCYEARRTTNSERLPEKCEFCPENSPNSAIRLDVRRGEREPWACGPCYRYLLDVVNMDNPLYPNGCVVCLSQTEDDGTRFRLCDECLEDITEGRRILMKDGQTRTPPTELLTGDSRTDPITSCGDSEPKPVSKEGIK
jgi:hypothetical protein